MRGKIPQRSCIGCGSIKDKSALLRRVCSKEGIIEPDESGKKSGRGAYICRDLNCLKEAKKKKSFNKAFKMNVSEEVYVKIEECIGSTAE